MKKRLLVLPILVGMLLPGCGESGGGEPPVDYKQQFVQARKNTADSLQYEYDLSVPGFEIL